MREFTDQEVLDLKCRAQRVLWTQTERYLEAAEAFEAALEEAQAAQQVWLKAYEGTDEDTKQKTQKALQAVQAYANDKRKKMLQAASSVQGANKSLNVFLHP